jgi:hypothetical protein
MAAITERQENASKMWFQTHMDAGKTGLSDIQYARLEDVVFKKPSGIFPLGTTKKDLEWKENYDKQWSALLMFYLIPKSVPLSGWEWSRDESDGMMSYLNRIAQNRCGVTGSLDSWNPMDIVGVKKNAEGRIKNQIDDLVLRGGDNLANREILNGIMIEAINNKELMPVSLKKINDKEKPGLELSKDLKGRNAKIKAIHHFRYSNFKCDLEWDKNRNEWKFAQEVSWDMDDNGGGQRQPLSIHVQARAFQAKEPREKPQHSLASPGAGAMLGKASIKELDSFVTGCSLSKVPSPGGHAHIPSAGSDWSDGDKQYWISLYTELRNATIEGNGIEFGNPGVYGEAMVSIRSGFAAALDAAIVADTTEKRTPDGRAAGSRLTAKLWGMEWLKRYWEMSKRQKFDAFAHTLLKASKKEAPGMGPFIKIMGR